MSAVIYMKHAEFEDKILFENLCKCKRFFARRLLKEFTSNADSLNIF